MATRHRQYIDFKLYLTAAPERKGACQVALLPTPEVGEAITPVVVPADTIPKSDHLAYLANKQITLRNLAALGKQLGECLLPVGPIRELFRDAHRHAGEDRGVRLRLIIADRALKQWPWEYAYLDLLGDGPDSMRGFLALNKAISFVRHEPLPYPHPALTPAPAGLTQLPMLITAALPEGEKELDLDQEIDTVKQAVTDFDLAGVRIVPKVIKDATRNDLSQALLGPGSACIFHFAGHGVPGIQRDDFNRGVSKESGYILLLADRAKKQRDQVSGEELARHLQGAGVRLAVLGACHSGRRDATYPWDGVASALVAQGIPAIIAMQYEVVDLQAIAFSRAFYAALGLGLSLDEAAWSGRVAMLESTATELDAIVNVEWGVPVLYSRLPDGALFPERIKESGSGPAAEAFRKVFTQTIAGIQEGTMTGVKVDLIENGVKIVQKVKEVRGEITGIQAGTAGANANIVVEQEIEAAGKDTRIFGGVFDKL
jgi:hypothetical protein